jgi:Major tropism determinant N-terminal domain
LAYRRILIRRDTAANWTAANPTLAAGELGGETDTGKVKLGNGSTAWNSLAYQGGVSSVNGVTGAVTGIVTTSDSGTVTSTMIANGTIVDGDISASASVAYSKLALSNSIVNADIATNAAIVTTKITGWEDDQVILSNQVFG